MVVGDEDEEVVGSDGGGVASDGADGGVVLQKTSSYRQKPSP